MAIQFFKESVTFTLEEPSKLKKWITEVIEENGASRGELNYIFCNDEYLLNINQEYLDHDYYTDIITFDQSEREGDISGDIYISIERVQENATQQNVGFMNELRRVMIHGVLHLLGHDDHSDEDKGKMRKKEEASLSLYPE